MASFHLKQKVFSTRARYKLYDQKDQLAYEASARPFSFGWTIDLTKVKDKKALYTIKRRRFKFRPTYVVLDHQGKQVAKTIKRLAFLKQKVTVDTIHGAWRIEGTYWAHHFSLMGGNQTLALMQKKRLSFGDTYVIDLTGNHDEALYLTLMVLIDSKFHSRQSNKRKTSSRPRRRR